MDQNFGLKGCNRSCNVARDCEPWHWQSIAYDIWYTRLTSITIGEKEKTLSCALWRCFSGTYFAYLGWSQAGKWNPTIKFACFRASTVSYIVWLFVATHAHTNLGLWKLCYEGCRVFVEKIKDRQTLKCARCSTFELSSCWRLMGLICRIQMQCLEPEVTWISDAWLSFVNTCWDSCSARRYKVQWKYDTAFEIKLSTYLFLYVPYK